MARPLDPTRLDIAAIAHTGLALAGEVALADLPRLAQDAAPGGSAPAVRWQARGQEKAQAHGAPQPWLHLAAQADLPLVCQRCLSPVMTAVSIDRVFRFVPDEGTAAAEDEDAQEDVLALSDAFDLLALLEDELLMALPLVPRHETCPQPLLGLQATAEVPEQGDVPHPFAALAKLRLPKGVP